MASMIQSGSMALDIPVSSFHQYVAAVEKFPVLEETEERAIAERYCATEDVEAAWQLVTSHLRYVVAIARGFSGYGLPQEDLVQEGNVGLMKAVQKYDPSRGVRLLGYAVHWIRAAMHEYILNNWRIVKIATTKAKRKLFFKLRSAKQRLDWLNREEAECIAKELGVRRKDVFAMEGALYLTDESYDRAESDEEDEGIYASEYLGDDSLQPELLLSEDEFTLNAMDELMSAFDVLDDRSKDIVSSRWIIEEKSTLHELADRYGISAERVRQIEKRAFEKMRAQLRERLSIDNLAD